MAARPPRTASAAAPTRRLLSLVVREGDATLAWRWPAGLTRVLFGRDAMAARLALQLGLVAGLPAHLARRVQRARPSGGSERGACTFGRCALPHANRCH